MNYGQVQGDDDHQFGAGSAEDQNKRKFGRLNRHFMTLRGHWKMVAAILECYDLIIVNLSYFLVLWLRFDLKVSAIEPHYISAWLRFIPIYSIFCMLVFWWTRLYKSLWKYTSYSELMKAFQEHERSHANDPLPKGPFANFLTAVSNIQTMFPGRENVPIRTALVTSRNAPAHERAIKTLRAWNVRIDEAFFLGGVSKKEILDKFGAHIFFDDQHTHTDPAAEVVPSAFVPYRDGDDPTK